MLCTGHSVERHALARYCVECGGEIGRRSVSATPEPYVVEHDPATLLCYLGISCLIARESRLHCLDSELRLRSSIPLQQAVESPSLCAADGFLYLAAQWGVHCFDLVTWLQSGDIGDPEKIVLTSEPAFTPVTPSGNSLYWINSSAKLCGWVGRDSMFEIRVPELSKELPTFAPCITRDHALIVQRGGRQVHVLDLAARKARPRLDVGGKVVYAAPGISGMSMLVDTPTGKRIILATATQTTTVVAALSSYVTWITPITGSDRYLWGDGSQCFVQSLQGVRCVDVNGNLGIVKIEDGAGWGVVETAENSSAVLIDLASGRVRNSQALGGHGFMDFAVSQGRFVASNGHAVRSATLQ